MVKRFFALLADATDLRNRAARALGCVSYEDTRVGALPARLFRPPENGRKEEAGVVFCPAWLVDHRLYTRLCLGLAASGYHVLAFDFIGEGRAPGTSWTSWDTFLDGRIFYHRRNAENARAALDLLEKVVDGGPMALAGHSRGGYQAATLPDRRVGARVSIQPFNWIVPPASWFVLPAAAGKINELLASFGGSQRTIPLPAEPRVGDKTLFFSGDLDWGLAPPLLNQLPMYRAARSPKAWVSIAGAEHLLPISDLPTFPHWTRSTILHYSVAWLDHHLRGDEEAAGRVLEARTGVSFLDAVLPNPGGATRKVFGVEVPRCPEL